MQNAIIVDLDQTLCESSDIIREFLILPEKKDWKGYYNNLDKCELNKHIKNLIGCGLKKGTRIIFLTARCENSIEITEKWLENNFCKDYSSCLGCQLLMRPEKDFRPSASVKKDLYHEFIENKFNVECVIDDDKSVIDMFSSLGLNCLHVQTKVQYID